MYICFTSNKTEPLNLEIIPNLMLPDQETFPTLDEAGKLHRELFVTNSKLMELINQQTEFERQEQQGMEVETSLT